MSSPSPSAWFEPLTQREIEILYLIKKGLSNREIADTLHLSLETVKWYNKQTFSKLGVNSRTKAVAKAREYGLLAERGAPTEQEAIPPPHNLPYQPTPFIGREEELDELAALLEDPSVRLVTITGPGGIGKTRLALGLAERLLEGSASQRSARGQIFPEGIFFIPLNGVGKPALVFPELANVLNFQFEKGGSNLRTTEQQLLDYLSHKQMLLVMDNFEHLVDGAGLLVEILRSTPEIKILVTSREGLNLVEEYLYLTKGLPYPELENIEEGSFSSMEEIAAYPAMRFFLQSARRFQPGFSLTRKDLAAVVHICHQVEGMPLALELAASWLDILSVSEIAAEIDQSLDIMHTGARNVRERHRSMKAVFDSTWQRLTLNEQEALAQLSLFPGSFSRDAAQRITSPAASLGLLASLANKSLLSFDRNKGRFHIHELLRQYGRDKISLRPDKAAAFQERFSEYFTSISQRLANDLKGPEQLQAMLEMERDSHNMRSAWEWAANHRRVDLLLRAFEAFGLFYQRQGRYQEGESIFAFAVSQLSSDDPVDSIGLLEEDQALKIKVTARLLIWQSNFNFILGRVADSKQLLQKSIILIDRLVSNDMDIHAEIAYAGYQQGMYATIEGDRELARNLCLEAVDHFRACQDIWGCAMALEQLCLIDWYLGNQENARRWGEESLHLRQKLGDLRGMADSLITLSDVVADEFNLEEARSNTEQAVNLYEELGDRDKVVYGVFMQGDAWMRAGEYSRAYELQVKSYQMALELNLRQIMPKLASELSYVNNHLGNFEETRQWAEKSMPLARKMGDQRSLAVSLYSLGLTGLAQEQYLDAYQNLVNSAEMVRAMKDRRLLAIILAALGRAAFGAGILQEVKPSLFEALTYCIEVHSSQAPLEAFVQIAFVLCREDEDWARARAVELFSLATHYPYVTNSRWLMETTGTEIERFILGLPIHVVRANQPGALAGEVWSTATELHQELFSHGWVK
jgi:predicted ATPase/DNA-binding CsgD family transcriptional regulator